ncbi:hypothetical protein I5L01_15985, partial [Erythrobacter sp. YJ-T3-07]|uniref:hypothetical protein n=1 Tax=Erythrobacter sp. YJ-T3-07 TaxID=2793063 RepID=UPI0018D39192
MFQKLQDRQQQAEASTQQATPQVDLSWRGMTEANMLRELRTRQKNEMVAETSKQTDMSWRGMTEQNMLSELDKRQDGVDPASARKDHQHDENTTTK